MTNTTAPALQTASTRPSLRGLPRAASLLVAILTVSASAPGLHASTPPATAKIPIQAELQSHLDASQLKKGSIVFARVLSPWRQPGCSLRTGAILKGHIAALTPYSKSSRVSDLTLVFDAADCDGALGTTLPLTLVSIIGTDYTDEAERQAGNQVADLPLAIGRSASAAGNLVNALPKPARPRQVNPGEVVGIAHMKPFVGGGLDGGTVISTTGRNVRLERLAELVLVNIPKDIPKDILKSQPSTPSSAISTTHTETASAPAAAPAPPAELPDETDVCAADCSLPLPSIASAQSSGSLPLASVGFGAHSNREMADFDNDATLNYLGPDELLFTFNPHQLIRRIGDEQGTVRQVRALLIDTSTNQIQRSLLWRIHGRGGQYLWPAGPGHVLIHIGTQLRLLGPGLKQQQSLNLDLPLAYVAPSPSGAYFAVGLIRERHTSATHQQLVDQLGMQPEEDIEVRVVDAHFKTLSTQLRSSRVAPPVLSDNGEVRVEHTIKDHFQIVEYPWAGGRHVLARTSSSCHIRLTALAPDLVFTQGCTALAGQHWFRVLKPTGRPVLKDTLDPHQVGIEAINTSPASFAVRSVASAVELVPGQIFRSQDLQAAQVTVYDAHDGHTLLAAKNLSPLPTQQIFALSPSGSQLAVLQSSSISFYPLAPATPPLSTISSAASLPH